MSDTGGGGLNLPHPGPLPKERERENGSDLNKSMATTGHLGTRRKAQLFREALSASPLLGERVKVRAEHCPSQTVNILCE